MANKAKFSSKIGLIAATVGSSVGLGNIWRFPAEVQSNGGAAFLHIYIICVALLGIPVMLAEFSLGRAGQTDTVSVFSRLAPKKKWWIAGALALLASYMILSFYMVVAGWTFSYLWESITGNLFAGINYDSTSGLETGFTHKMEQYICSNTEPLINTYIMILANIGVLLLGVRKGIERMSNILMPLLFLLLLIFAGVSLTLPGAEAGVSYFLTPDFSKITPSVVVSALGQAFFSLSVAGNGTLIYGSYLSDKEDIPASARNVAFFDTVAAMLAAMVIIPAMATAGAKLNQGGPMLMFVFLPNLFRTMPGGNIIAIVFFVAVTFAGLTSLINLYESPIATLQERFKIKRLPACIIVGALGLGISLLIQHIVSDWMDIISIYICPLGAGLAGIMFFWVLGKKLAESEISKGRLKPLPKYIIPLARYVF